MNLPHTHLGIKDDSHTFKLKAGKVTWEITDFKILKPDWTCTLRLNLKANDSCRSMLYDFTYLTIDVLRNKNLSQIIKENAPKDLIIVKNFMVDIPEDLLIVYDDKQDEKKLESLIKKENSKNNLLLLLC